MPDITDRSPATAGTTADYQKTIRVNASPGQLFDALTSVVGLAAWWVPVTGSGEADGELRFTMNSPDPLVIHVDDATRPATVRWTVTECNSVTDWVGTRPAFTITAVAGGGSELHFRHGGLTPELECIEMCTSGWNHYLGSLRDYVETGRGAPRRATADEA
jgi:uncharacterized protein YndB with AHSA1/START domain